MVQKNSLNKLLIICGPTASGKTALAVECAKILDTEVISADSMNVYRGLNVGTAKPDDAEKDGVVHHLIDVASPFEKFSVGDYKEKAEPIVKDLIKNNKIPIICGGTGFYINSLIYDFSYGNSSGNMEVRKKYTSLAEEKGAEYVYSILQLLDPDSASKIHCNDVKRVVRALEIYSSGTKKSDIKDSFVPKINYKAVSFDFPRDELYKRIDRRVDEMIKNGLTEEVRRLKDQGITLNNQCMQGIGYKEIYLYLDGEYTLSEAIEKIKLNTHHYAKRQITFFKKLPGIEYLVPGNVKTIAEKITGEI